MGMKVLVGVDGSDASIAALHRAVGMVEAFGGSLTILTVVHLSGFYYSALALPTTQTTEEDIESAISAAVWQAVAPALAAVPDSIPITKIDARGHAGQEIIDAAIALGADLIVVGSRGFGPIRSSILGSTSRFVTQHATCDVLVVHEPAG
jgi:nucleotide-binding universal stress UspA family protein